MYNDIRMQECDTQEALAFLEKCCGQWIYIKNICNIRFNNKNQQTATYAKFKVRNIFTKYESIEIFGEEDDDRLVIDYACVVSMQMTFSKDELLIIVEEGNTEIDIRIKKYIPMLKHRLSEIVQANKNLIITEGKTDWKHLKNALNRFREQGEYQEFEFEFFEYEDEVQMGADTLLQVCKYNKLFPNPHLKIFVFDADKNEINEMHQGKDFIYHGNNVFSLIIPVPEFRAETPLISIENYYTDDEIRTQGNDGRRLYLNVEFDHDSGVLISDTKIIDLDVGKHKKMGSNYIIDDKVFKMDTEVCINEIDKDEIRKTGKNIALSKSRFADNILNSVAPFNQISHENFRLILDIIMEIKNSHEIMPFDVSKQELVNRIENENGIVINYYKNNLKAMEIHTKTPEVLIGHRRISSTVAGMKIVDNKVQIVLIIENHQLSLGIPLSVDIIRFLHEKIDNPYNRIELFLHEEDRVGTIELFSGDAGSALIERAMQLWG